MKNKIIEILESLDRESALKIISEILDEQYELRTASSLVKKDCEPWVTKGLLTGHQYGEGNEEAGFIDLSTILGFAEEILNCDDTDYGNVEFQHFVRPETDAEIEENEHDKNVTWYTEDESIKIEKLQIQFEMS